MSFSIGEIHTADNEIAMFSEEIDDFLRNLGYEIDTPISVLSDGRKGFNRCYKTKVHNPGYYVYVNINTDRVDVYREYACGGKVRHFEIDVPDISSKSEMKDFLEKVFNKSFNDREDPTPT